MSRLNPFPDPPWRLHGQGLVRFQVLATEQVRHRVPPGVPIVSVAPGRTLGGVYFAHYGRGSTLEYHELIVFPAIVRHGTRIGAWISHIYVDDLRSLVAGRNLWGLPKQMATFAWRWEAERIQLTATTEPGGTLCRIDTSGAGRGSGLGWPAPLYAPVLSDLDGGMLGFAAKGRSRITKSQGELVAPESSPISSLGITGGTHWLLNDFSVSLPSPTELGPCRKP